MLAKKFVGSIKKNAFVFHHPLQKSASVEGTNYIFLISLELRK